MLDRHQVTRSKRRLETRHYPDKRSWRTVTENYTFEDTKSGNNYVYEDQLFLPELRGC